MSDYILYGDGLYCSDELKHYGVLGMKWGVRKNPSKAFAKSSKHYNKLKRKGTLNVGKTAALRKIGMRKELYGWSSRRRRKGQKQQYKAAKMELKAARYSRKADSWLKKMEKHFAQVKLSDISPEHIEIGKEFTYMLMEDNK